MDLPINVLILTTASTTHLQFITKLPPNLSQSSCTQSGRVPAKWPTLIQPATSNQKETCRFLVMSDSGLICPSPGQDIKYS